MKTDLSLKEILIRRVEKLARKQEKAKRKAVEVQLLAAFEQSNKQQEYIAELEANGELSSKYQMLVEKFDKLHAVNNALIKERDELLEAATAPPKQPTTRPQLSNEQVWDIRDMIANQQGDSVIAKRLGVKASAVWRIRHGKAYKKVPGRPHPSVQPQTKKPVTAHAGHGIVEQKK